MIEISRAPARSFRTVLRRCLADQPTRPKWPPLLVCSGVQGLDIQADAGDVVVRYRLPGAQPSACLAFGPEALSEFEGRKDDPVMMEPGHEGRIRARWTDGRMPRLIEFAAIEPDQMPSVKSPVDFTPMPVEFLIALHEASLTAVRDSPRLGLTRVLLRGKGGEVLATDGKQLLVQRGFKFPWQDDVLVPRLTAIGMRELADEEEVGVGRTSTHVGIRIGPWSFLLAIDTASRFPDVQAVIPRPASIKSRLHLDAQDASFLADVLPRLPGGGDEHAPVTLDLASPPRVRARDEYTGQSTEATLARSSASGEPVRLYTDRLYLGRAARLGFTEVGVARPHQPVCCRDERRIFVWMALDPKEALPPGKADICIASDDAAPPDSIPEPSRRKPTMPEPERHDDRPTRNGADHQPDRNGAALHDLIAEAEEVRTELHEASTKVARLIAALKQQKRQSRALRAAVSSLRQLHLDH